MAGAHRQRRAAWPTLAAAGLAVAGLALVAAGASATTPPPPAPLPPPVSTTAVATSAPAAVTPVPVVSQHRSGSTATPAPSAHIHTSKPTGSVHAPAPPAVQPAPPHRMPPDSLAIPGQGVVAPVVGTCREARGGAVEPPTKVSEVCWWRQGASPSATTGTTVITGHVNFVGQGTGALGRIAYLGSGDAVVTTDATGATHRWRVSHVTARPKSRGTDPAAFVGPTGPRRLVLVTCGGPFDADTGSYEDNVYAWLAPA